MHIEDKVQDILDAPIMQLPGAVAFMDLRSLLSSCVIELRSLRELCKQQRKRIDQLMEEIST